jgi:UDP-GlcNAc:undecaprenyl-phosphate GlcNAc-1-phosphate transferase
MGEIPDALRIVGALVVSLSVTAALVGPVRGLAMRSDFYDRPLGYKQHSQPTPYLGGLAVMAGFLAAAIPFGGALSDFAAVTLCAVGLCVVGTVDDRRRLGIGIRIVAQILAGLVLWVEGSGWGIGNDAFDLAVTLLWVVGVTNAFNLLDNLDGAAGTVGAVSAAGVGVLAMSEGDAVLGAFAFSLAGACAGFLPHNLARPSRIFLGDGGSTPIGFLLAAIVVLCPGNEIGWPGVLASAPLVGVAIFDTTLVVVSRARRRVTVLAGGRDHVTHRLLRRLGSERAVCLTLALSQAALIAAGFGLFNVGVEAVFVASVIYLLLGALILAFFEGVTVWAAREERAT